MYNFQNTMSTGFTQAMHNKRSRYSVYMLHYTLHGNEKILKDIRHGSNILMYDIFYVG